MNTEDFEESSASENDIDKPNTESTTKKIISIAKEAGVSVTTIYNRARKLGRLPTVEEAKAQRTGRKSKYK